jgi:DNA-binding PadR family transcriptional regulator
VVRNLLDLALDGARVTRYTYSVTDVEVTLSVRFGLLTLLAQAPMHGYQLRQEFEASTGSTWPLNIGQVYTTLARLARDELVQVTDEGDESQRVYRIAPAGRQAVADWFSTPVSASAPPRNELAIKLAFAVTMPAIDVRAVLQTQRTATMKGLQEFTRARENAGDDLSWLLVADSLIFAAEAELRWLDHSETRLVRYAGRLRPTRPHPADATAVSVESKVPGEVEARS